MSDTNTNPAAPGDVTISLSYPFGGDGHGKHVRLRVQEAMSGQYLVEVTMTAEQFTSIVSAAVITVAGATITSTPERIGKRMQNTSVSIRHGEAADIDAEAARVKAEYLADGWHAVRIDGANFGRRVVAYRWVDVDNGDES